MTAPVPPTDRIRVSARVRHDGVWISGYLPPPLRVEIGDMMASRTYQGQGHPDDSGGEMRGRQRFRAITRPCEGRFEEEERIARCPDPSDWALTSVDHPPLACASRHERRHSSRPNTLDLKLNIKMSGGKGRNLITPLVPDLPRSRIGSVPSVTKQRVLLSDDADVELADAAVKTKMSSHR